MQDFGSFLNCQATKEAELHDAALLWIKAGEVLQRVVQCDHFRCLFLRDHQCVVEFEIESSAASLGAGMTTSMVDKNRAHELSGEAEKVGPVLPVDVFAVDQSHKSFVHECSGL